MKILSFIARGLAIVVVAVLLLDSFGGMLFDGPVGPIPGGALSGPVDANPNPTWPELEKVIELEIRPAKPWSLSIWNVVIDGELYVPSAMGAWRRWTEVAVEEPLARVRVDGRVYERRIVRVTDPVLRQRIGKAMAERYELEAPVDPDEDTTWYFHLAPRE